MWLVMLDRTQGISAADFLTTGYSGKVQRLIGERIPQLHKRLGLLKWVLRIASIESELVRRVLNSSLVLKTSVNLGSVIRLSN